MRRGLLHLSPPGGERSARVCAPGEGALPQLSDSPQRPLTRIPSLRPESDLSPQAGRGGASGNVLVQIRYSAL
jgi:hypothetical protein